MVRCRKLFFKFIESQDKVFTKKSRYLKIYRVQTCFKLINLTVHIKSMRLEVKSEKKENNESKTTGKEKMISRKFKAGTLEF